jgi:hypothetical protein
MQMVRYHSLPHLEFPEYQINFVLHTFLTINDQPQQNVDLCINTIFNLIVRIIKIDKIFFRTLKFRKTKQNREPLVVY